VSLAGVRGNASTVAAMWHELARRPSQAYLFAGPRGIGKALIAKGLAHGLLCEGASGPEFCCAPEHCPVREAQATGHGRRAAATIPRCACCAGCVQLAAGVHPDFAYVGRAPNRTDVLIEQVRALIDGLGVRPARGSRRVAIIDDAETLNLPAQNALLKTLEEPPGQTMLILVSDNERALLDTVRSRLRPVRFAPLATAEVATVLVERAGLASDRAGVLARLARGSVRRGIELAEGDEPPSKELIVALGRAATMDFAGAQALAQEFFGTRERAADNFELIARLLEEMVCCKLLHSEPAATDMDTANLMQRMADRHDVATLATLADQALRARAAIDAMANSRLQAEQWWMAAGVALAGRDGETEHGTR
jgi:DNA polymerase-3 subunit delta'